MKLDELLVSLQRKNIGLRRNGSELMIVGDREELTPSLVSELRAYKTGLLALVGEGGETWWSRPVTITPEMLPLVRLTAEEIARIVAAVPGGAANVQDIYPLAPLQEGILFHHLMGGEGDPYILGSLYSFDSRKRIDRYLEAMQAVIGRHDILRTGVVWEGLPEPVQVVWRKAILPVEEVTLEAGAGDGAKQLYARYNPRSYRMDVGQAPLLRVAIAHDEEQGRWLMVQLRHHLAGDHVTQEVLHDEIQAYLLGQGDRLPEPLQFRNLVAQARFGVSQEEHEIFFRRLLGDVEEPTAPFGLLNIQGDGTGIEKARMKVEAGLAHRIREGARKLGVSAASLCHVAWAQVLARVCGREDVVFGTVLFGRMQGADRTMGLFMNTLPVRIQAGGQGAGESVRGVHKQLAELLRHEHASLALAQRCSGVPAPAPLFSSLLNYRHSTGAAQPRSEEKARAWEGIRGLYGDGGTNYPVTLSIDDFGEYFWLVAQVVEGSVDPQRVCEYTHIALESLVQALESEPARPLRSLEVMPEAERRQLVYEWNATEAEYPREKCAHELFEQQVEQTPDTVAVAFEDTTLSYSELNRRANQLAHHLRALGVGPDARVAICANRGLEMLIALLAVWKAGGAYIPLDPSYPVERLRYMLEDSAPVVVLTQGRWQELLAGGPAPIIDLEAAAEWREQPESNLAPYTAGGGSLAYVIYTSGSTGAPKGAMVEQGGMLNHLYAKIEDLELASRDVVAQTASQCFDISVWQFMAALVVGGRVLIVDEREAHDPEALLRTVDGAGVTVWETVPSMLDALVGEGSDSAELEGLRWVVVTGEACPAGLCRRWAKLHPRVPLLNAYGPTECSDDVTHYVMAAGWSGGEAQHAPIGRPLRNTQAYVLDRRGEVAPVGVSGELYIGGDGVGRGYWRRAELTAERFVADGFSGREGARLYRTGDLARWGEKRELEFLGRVDDQVKVRGYRIELGEIEARLAEHPSIREAVVIAREDRAGERRLVTYYTGAGVSAEQLRLHLTVKLPEYMAPAAYVRLEKFPLTPNGKLDRKALPAPDADAFGVRDYEEPQGETETALAGIWAELLKLDRVGRHDNFFELGGHSLLVVRVIARMRQAGWRVDVPALFATPVLSELVSTIRSQSNAVEVPVPPNPIAPGCDAITPEMLPLVQLTAEEIERIVAVVPGGAANVQDIYPLAPLQEGMLFHHLMGGENDPYILGNLYSFDSRQRLDNYLEAMQAVIGRHDILRTAVVWEGLREPVQVVWRKAILPVKEVTLEGGDGAKQLYARYNPRSYRMDVRQAPLLRVAIAQDEEKGRWLMVQLRHHLAGDHTTLEVLEEEIQAYLLGQGDRLAAPLPFRNLVAQARLGVSQEEHEIFFRRLLGDVEEPTAPFGLLNVQGDGTGIEQAHMKVEAGLARRIRERARKLGVSAASVCHVAWAQVLARVSGREDVVFGTVLFGRMQGGHGADRAMGLFINTLPVRIRTGQDGAQESVRGVHQQLAELLRHEHASLALAQRCSAVPAPAPLFSSLLNYRYSTGAAQARSEEKARAREGIQGLHREERTNYPVTLSVDDFGEYFWLKVQVEASVDAKRVCEYTHTALKSLVEALESEPARPLRSLAVVPEAERQQVVYEWNATQAEYPRDKCVHELFEEQVEKTPDAVAVAFEDTTLSYRELNRRANQLAHYLRELGIGPEERVAICVERSLEMMIGLLGVLKAGGAYIPLDSAYPPERLHYMLADSAPAVLLTQERLQGLFSGDLLAVDLEAAAPPWRDQPETNPDRVLRPEHSAYVIYTSGSTGQPKGVMIPHSALTNFLVHTQQEPGIGPDDIVLATTTLSFDIAALELYLPLTVGAHVRIASREAKLDGAQLQKELQREITVLQLTPTGWQMLIETGWQGTSGLKALCGGEALSRELAGKLVSRSHSVWNLYGPTETTVYSMNEKLGQIPGRVVIGRPIANTQIYILDKHGEPAAVGVAGELYIAGTGLARGYLNQGDLTAERFVSDPFAREHGARMYKTGDLGRWLPDGTIEYIGRNDFQVKVRGYRIELGEIEARLAEYDGVREAVVIAREDTAGDQRLVAYYTGAEVGAEVLRQRLTAKLPEYMAPAAYVRLERLPLTPNGKLDRAALPAPEGDAYAARGYEEPAGEMETAIARIWNEVLRVERVGRHDNFFELGGHSLLVVRVIARLRKVLNIEVMMSDLFAHPLLSSLAERLIDLQLEQFDPDKLSDLMNLMREPYAD